MNRVRPARKQELEGRKTLHIGGKKDVKVESGMGEMVKRSE